MRWFEETPQTGHPGSVSCCSGTVLRLWSSGWVGVRVRGTLTRYELYIVGLGPGIAAQRGGEGGGGHLRQPGRGAMARTTRGLVVLVLGSCKTHGAGEGITAVGQ